MGSGSIMARREKFLFDTCFDAERSARARAAAEAKAAAEAPPPPTFGEAELAEARETAFAEGKAAGLAEAGKTNNARLAAAVEALPPILARMAEEAAAETEERHRSTLEAALTVVRKLFPQLARAHGLEEAHAVIAACLDRLRDEPRVVVRCADGDLDALRERAEQASARGGFEGKLVFLADERLAPGDLRVEWADGGAERDQASLWREIDAVIARAVSPAGEADGSRKTQRPAAPKGAAAPTPQPETPAAVQPLRRAQSA